MKNSLDLTKQFISYQALQDKLLKIKAPSLVRMVSSWVDPNPLYGQQYAIQPLNWRNALKLSGWNIFKNMYSAAVVLDALQLEAAKYRAAEINILNQQIKEQIKDESNETARPKPLRGEDNPEGVANAGDSLNQSDSLDPEIEPLLSHAKVAAMGAMWAARMNSINQANYAGTKAALEMNQDFDADKLDQHAADNAHQPEFRDMHAALLDHMTDHAQGFSLENVALANRFLNRLVAMVQLSDKSLKDIQSEGLGAVIGKDLDHHIGELHKLANEMINEAEKALTSANHPSPKPVPKPAPNAADFNAEVSSMGPTPDDPGTALLQWRLALVKLMYPDTPQPTNALNTKMDNKKGVDTSPRQSHVALAEEFGHYADQLGVNFKVLEKAADKSMQHMFPSLEPHVLEAMKEHSAAPNIEKSLSLAQREMRKKMGNRPDPSAR